MEPKKINPINTLQFCLLWGGGYLLDVRRYGSFAVKVQDLDSLNVLLLLLTLERRGEERRGEERREEERKRREEEEEMKWRGGHVEVSSSTLTRSRI